MGISLLYGQSQTLMTNNLKPVPVQEDTQRSYVLPTVFHLFRQRKSAAEERGPFSLPSAPITFRQRQDHPERRTMHVISFRLLRLELQ